MGVKKRESKYADVWAACRPDKIAFVVGALVSHVRNIALTFQDPDAKALAQRGCVSAYLSDSADGSTITASAPTSLALGTNGVVIPATPTLSGMFDLVCNAAGLVDVNITNNGVATWYLVIVLPDGRIVVSPAITMG